MGAQGGGVVAGADALRRKRRPGWRRRRRRPGRRWRRGRPGRRRRRHGPHGGGVGGSWMDRDLILGEGIRIGRYGGRNRRYMALFSFFRLCAKIWHGGKLWKILGGNQARVVVLSLRFGAFTWVLGGLAFLIHTIIFQIKLCIHTI